MTAPSELNRPKVAPVPLDRRAEGVGLLVQLASPDEREHAAAAILEALEQGEVAADGLLGAWRGTRLAGIALAQVYRGRTASIWLPSLPPEEPESTALLLLDAACREIAEREVCFAQVLLESVAPAQDRLLTACGFRHLADLLYLVCPSSAFPQSSPVAPFDLEPSSPANDDRLCAIVEATYRESRDCPALDGLRAIEDVLDGYAATGASGRGLWWIVRRDGQDAGCLLLADHPAHGNCELVYMGIAPTARGRGFGLMLTRQAQWLTHRAGRDRLVLAVDAQNDPALRVYTAAGFDAWDRRTVYYRLFRPAG